MNRSEKVLKVKCSLNFGGEGTAMRAVIAASLAALSISGVYAQDSVPLPQAGDTTAGASSDYTQESSIKEYPSKLEGGGYTLTRLEQKPDSGDFVTGYSYDSLNKTATPAYYRLDLKQTEYGTGDSVKYWGWTTNENGNKTFGEVGESEADVTFRYNTPASSLDRVDSSGGSSSITIDDITGSFVGQTGVSGGAVSFINTNIDKITADFINNFATTKGGAIYHDNTVLTGGTGSIQAIIGDFIGNNVKNGSTSAVSGGAIYTTQDIGNINGDFVGNYVYTRNSDSASGGAIANRDTIGSIEGNFIGNYLDSAMGSYGGAIFNSTGDIGGIGSIKGDFLGNHAVAVTMQSSGGAIANMGTIGSIEGNFIGNYASANAVASGGAIGNEGTIGSISGDFIGNYTESAEMTASGGAIANINYQTYVGLDSLAIDSISGNFIGNYAESVEQSASGGAIDNKHNIGSISGDFIGNYTESAEMTASGGAISNSKTIGSISGDFIGNYASGSKAQGGAIYNSGRIGGASYDVPEDKILVVYGPTFVNTETGEKLTLYLVGTTDGGYAPVSELENLIKEGYKIFPEMLQEERPVDSEQWAETQQQYDDLLAQGFGSAEDPTKGLAEDAFATVTYYGITGDFVGNYAEAKGSAALGGAVYNQSQIRKIDGDFINNYAVSEGSSASGGAVYNTSVIYEINGDFIGNYAKSQKKEAQGGAVYNSGNVVLNGDFIGNRAESAEKNAAGGAVYNARSIESITGDFIGNTASGNTGAAGGAIYNQYVNSGAGVGSIKGDFVNNSAETITGKAYGGAIANVSGYEKYYGTYPSTIDTISGSFIGNHAVTSDGEAKGGAIYSENDLLIEAKDGYVSEFTGNYTESGGVRDYNAIYMAQVADNKLKADGETKASDGFRPSTLTLSAVNNSAIIMNDKIAGENGYSASSETTVKNEETGKDEIVKVKDVDPARPYTVKLTGDNTSTIQINNDIEAFNDDGSKGSANIEHSNVNLHLAARDNVLDNSNLTLNSGSFNMINNQAGVSALNTFTLSGDVNMMVDVDLANSTMDRITAQNYGEHTGNINVTGMNLLSDAPEGVNTTDIYFAEQGLKDHVTNGAGALPDSKWQTTAYTPIYKYNVTYDNREDAGYFLFTRGQGGSSGGSTGGNPSDIFNPGILASPVAAQAGAYAAQNAAFTYAFTHPDTFMPLPSVDRFALRHANQYALSSYDSLSMQMNDLQEKGIWVRPYTSFESIPLDNGPDVDTITYGTMIGGDSKFKELKNGWGTVFTGYIGYNGSSQHYDGVNTYQNGGLIGATQSFYKGSFFTALTASVGASAGESHNMYGKDDFTMLMAGIASKSGYNIEFKNGKFIIQPSLLLSYSFINTFDYTTASGVHMDSDPMHAIQINPNVKFIGNLKNGWQPYASVGMVWNLLDGTNVRADNVRLPEMSIKPYVEYGVGIQKRWQDKYTGYVQAMVRNGGRNGVALTAGFRWALGQDGKPIEKVDKNVNKTSRTDRIGILSW